MPEGSQTGLSRRSGRGRLVLGRRMDAVKVGVGLIIGGLAVLYLVFLLAPVSASPSPAKVVIVPPGSSAAEVGAQLRSEGLIRSAWAFKTYLRITGMARSLRPGEYLISPQESGYQIARRVWEGDTVKYRFTVPEGYTVAQIAALLEKNGLTDKQRFLDIAKEGDFPYPFLERRTDTRYQLEGFLFPDTYEVSRNMSPEEIIGMMLRRFAEVFKEDYVRRAEELGMSVYDVVTLASVIEKEAKKPEERSIVSSVFHNRLKRGMKLESCATVQYALGTVKQRLTVEDTRYPSPYNTYLHPGLPPGPISCPGEAAIRAALFPADTEYLYFVARPDGSHVFSRTLTEHDRARVELNGEAP